MGGCLRTFLSHRHSKARLILPKGHSAASSKSSFALPVKAFGYNQFACRDLHKAASRASSKSSFALPVKAFGHIEFACRDLHKAASRASSKSSFALSVKAFGYNQFACRDLRKAASRASSKSSFALPVKAFSHDQFACRDLQKAFAALPIIAKITFPTGPAVEENLKSLIEVLVQEPTEKEWLEFKKENADPKMIGKDISALANGALLTERNHAYMVWGVDDQSHRIVGTNFSPYEKYIGNQELLSWLHKMLSDNAYFRFEEVYINDKRVILVVVSPASQYPVAFQKEPYIRVGSYTKRLADEPKLQCQLWDTIRNEQFELSSNT